jgi:hypothetical protein
MSAETRRPKRPVGLVISLVLLGLSIVAFAVSGKVDPYERHISLTDAFHVSLHARGADARVVFFNNEFGPYQGGLITVGSKGAPPSPDEPGVTGFGDFLGIYYRHIRWPDGALWTLDVSLWYPIILFGLCALWAGRRRARRAGGKPMES